MTQVVASHGRLDWVDTLRGAAVLFVFMLHATLDVAGQRLDGQPAPFAFELLRSMAFGVFDFGKIGVAIFFIISGYLIPVTLDRVGQHAVRNFLANRFFRLYPAYWTSILILFAASAAAVPLVPLLVNLTMLQRFVGVADLNGVFWTLQIELIFYAVCVALKWRQRLGEPKLLAQWVGGCGVLAIALALVRWQASLKLPVALFLALQLMFFGYLLRQCVENHIAVTYSRWALATIVITLLVACPLAYSRNYGFDESAPRYIVSYMAAIGITLCAMHWRWKQRLLAFVGTISYSFYLVHTLVLSLVADAFRRTPPLQYASSFILFLLCSAALTIAASCTIYWVIEAPSIRFGRRVVKRLPTSQTGHLRGAP